VACARANGKRLGRPTVGGTILQAAADAIERVGAAIIQDFDRLRAALDYAVVFNHDDPGDLRVLSRVQGALPLLARQIMPFIAVGKAVTDAILAGRIEDAHALALGFTRFEDAFGPDLADMRNTITSLTEAAAQDIHADQRVDATLSFTLFLIASAIGLAISSIGSKQVVAASSQARGRSSRARRTSPRSSRPAMRSASSPAPSTEWSSSCATASASRRRSENSSTHASSPASLAPATALRRLPSARW
jgi:hypothetical protein